MTLTLALLNLRDRLDEPTAGFWTDAQLRRYINEAARDLSRRSKAIRKEGTVTIVAGTQDYSLSSLAFAELSPTAHFTPTGISQKYPVEYKDLAVMNNIWGVNQAVNRGDPAWWTTTNTSPPNLSIRLYPVPSRGGALTIRYFALATELATDGSADASSVDCPAGWEDTLLDYAEYRAYIQARKPDMATLALQRYDNNYLGLVETADRFVDAPGEIMYDDGGFGWDW